MQVECPGCGKVVAAADEQAGQVINCPACGGRMQLPAEPAPGAGRIGLQPPVTGGYQPSLGAGLGTRNVAPSGPTRSCPYCGEKILVAAQKCRFCQTILVGPDAGKSAVGGPDAFSAASEAPASGEGVAALICGIIGLLTSCLPVVPLALGIAALVLAKKAGDKGSTTGMVTAGKVLGILALVLGGLMQCQWLVGLIGALSGSK